MILKEKFCPLKSFRKTLHSKDKNLVWIVKVIAVELEIIIKQLCNFTRMENTK